MALSVSVGIFYLARAGPRVGIDRREEKIAGNWYAGHNTAGGWIDRNGINTTKMEKHTRETFTSLKLVLFRKILKWRKNARS